MTSTMGHPSNSRMAARSNTCEVTELFTRNFRHPKANPVKGVRLVQSVEFVRSRPDKYFGLDRKGNSKVLPFSPHKKIMMFC